MWEPITKRANHAVLRPLWSWGVFGLLGFLGFLGFLSPLAWPINTAAGLEVGLIANFDLPWNLRGV